MIFIGRKFYSKVKATINEATVLKNILTVY
jgi:hypothetical protein